MYIKNPLIPLRFALFMWYGAGKVPVSYLSVFMKQKGLSIVEYSSIFSVTFVFQFLTAFMSGVVADKIGNAKPILIFHVLVTMLSILTFLLAPNIHECCPYTSMDNQTQDWTNASNIIVKVMTINSTIQNETVLIDGSDVSHERNLSKFISFYNTQYMHGEEKRNITENNTVIVEKECEIYHKSFLFINVIAMIVFFSSWSAVYRFMDVTIMTLVPKHNSSFGHERLFAISGDLIITFLTGIILNSFASSRDENNYSTVYWSSLIIFLVVLIAVCNIENQIKMPSQNMWKQAVTLLKSVDMLVFVAIVFALGTLFCFYDNFIMWFLEFINASTVVMGLQQTVNALYGLPIYLTSNWWLKKFGPKKLFILALIGYVIRGIGYSFLNNPWWCLLIETSMAFTYHLFWVAVVVHCHEIASEELVSTVIATVGAVHFGVGRSSGTVMGGLIMNAVGPQTTFQILAGMSLTVAILYASYLRCRSLKNVTL